MSSAHTLGAYLRRYRERFGLSVEAVSAGSRIVPRLVDALEADRHDVLPAPVYVRGFIRAYCVQVGADADEALRLYEERVGPPQPLTVKAPGAPQPPLPAGRRPGPVAAALLLVGFGIGAVLVLGHRQPGAGASHGVGGLSIAARAPVSAVPSMSTATASTASTPGPAERVLVMRALEATWVRVQPDDGEPTEETLAAGAVRQWRGMGRFHVTLGNAGGVELELDGQTLPALGERGQVVQDAIVPPEVRP
jgi:cytoskeleton protein RodZ